MKIKPANEIIGHWVCPNGGKAEVYQTIKAGRHFYTRCACCGLIQGTGKALQQRIYDNAVFFNKSAIAVPSGVDIGAFLDAEVGQEIKHQSKPENGGEPQSAAVDFDPSEVERDEPEKQGEGIFKKIAPFIVVMAAIGVGVWTS